MIDINKLLNIINKNKEEPNLYKLQISNNHIIYGYIKDITKNNNIITFNYVNYFTEFDSVYKVENKINTKCIITEPDKMRGIFKGIFLIYE